jgi:hypothetical protein
MYIESSELFEMLNKKKEKIESEFGDSLSWEEAPEKKASRIRSFKSYSIIENDDWTDIFDWMIEKILLYQEVFGKYI